MVEPLEPCTLLTISQPDLLGSSATTDLSPGLLPVTFKASLDVKPISVKADSSSVDPATNPTIVVTVADATSNQDPSKVAVTVSDSAGRHIPRVPNPSTGRRRGSAPSCSPAPVTTALSGGTITVSFTGTAADPGFAAAVDVYEVDGLVTPSPFDANGDNQGTGTSASVTLNSPPSGTTSDKYDIILGSVGVVPASVLLTEHPPVPDCPVRGMESRSYRRHMQSDVQAERA